MKKIFQRSSNELPSSFQCLPSCFFEVGKNSKIQLCYPAFMIDLPLTTYSRRRSINKRGGEEENETKKKKKTGRHREFERKSVRKQRGQKGKKTGGVLNKTNREK